MLTIFTIPKAFKGHIGTIQRNAIKSWSLLRPQPEIIIFGEEYGTEDTARDCRVKHVPAVAQNEFRTPLLSDLFDKAEMHATHPVLCYVNADIVLMDDFSRTVQLLCDSLREFLMVGCRWDVDIRTALDFRDPSWQARVRDLALKTNRRRPHNWIDYFVFSTGLGRNLPPFAVGRTCWDNWLIWHARKTGASVVDASEGVVAVHQNHDYAHHPQGEAGAWRGEEATRNVRLSGGRTHRYTINNATHYVAEGTTIRRVSLGRRIGASVEPISAVLFDLLVHRTLRFRQRLGLRRSTWRRIFSR
jgi:hypothetical protein